MDTLKIGSWTVYPYGLVLAAAAAAALLVMAARKKRYGLDGGTVLLFGVLAVPLCVLCARAGYWLCSIDWIQNTELSFWQFTDGGYMLYGAVLGGAAAALAAARGGRISFGRVADAAAVSAALLIAAGRFAEYLTDSGFGTGVLEWFDPEEEWSMIAWENPDLLCRFPFAVQNFYGTWRFAINFWEGLAALAFAVVLLRTKKRADGAEISLLLLMYAVCQMVFESMRRDEVLRWSFVRISQLFSALIVLGLLLFFWARQPRTRRSGKELAARLAALVFCVGIMMLMEFVLDQKIRFLLWIRADLSYLFDILCCAGILTVTVPLWRKAFPPVSSVNG